MQADEQNWITQMNKTSWPAISSEIPTTTTSSVEGQEHVLVATKNGPVDLFQPEVPVSPDASFSQPSGLIVRAEEIGLVLLVLLLWAGAVALFFNRWGKIRMLEPYQPKFNDAPRASLANTGVLVNSASHRPSYPLVELGHQNRLHSRLNMSGCCDFNSISAVHDSIPPGRRRATSILIPSSGSYLHSDISYGNGSRPRQNSVVVFATAHFLTAARKVKSAMDLQTLVLREETEENVNSTNSSPFNTSDHHHLSPNVPSSSVLVTSV